MAKLLQGTRIYRDITQILSDTLEFTKDFPRAYRYSVGQQMQELAIRMLNEVASAYITKDLDKKIAKLDDFQADFNTYKTLFRISFEKMWINRRGMAAHMIELTDSVGKQSTAWKNSLINFKRQGIKSQIL